MEETGRTGGLHGVVIMAAVIALGGLLMWAALGCGNDTGAEVATAQAPGEGPPTLEDPREEPMEMAGPPGPGMPPEGPMEMGMGPGPGMEAMDEPGMPGEPAQAGQVTAVRIPQASRTAAQQPTTPGMPGAAEQPFGRRTAPGMPRAQPMPAEQQWAGPTDMPGPPGPEQPFAHPAAPTMPTPRPLDAARPPGPEQPAAGPGGVPTSGRHTMTLRATGAVRTPAQAVAAPERMTTPRAPEEAPAQFANG